MGVFYFLNPDALYSFQTIQKERTQIFYIPTNAQFANIPLKYSLCFLRLKD